MKYLRSAAIAFTVLATWTNRPCGAEQCQFVSDENSYGSAMTVSNGSKLSFKINKTGTAKGLQLRLSSDKTGKTVLSDFPLLGNDQIESASIAKSCKLNLLVGKVRQHLDAQPRFDAAAPAGCVAVGDCEQLKFKYVDDADPPTETIITVDTRLTLAKF